MRTIIHVQHQDEPFAVIERSTLKLRAYKPRTRPAAQPDIHRALGLAKQRFKPSALRPLPRHREKESSFTLYTTFTTFTQRQPVNVVNIVKDALQRTPHARDASPRRTTLTDSIEQE